MKFLRFLSVAIVALIAVLAAPPGLTALEDSQSYIAFDHTVAYDAIIVDAAFQVEKLQEFNASALSLAFTPFYDHGASDTPALMSGGAFHRLGNDRVQHPLYFKALSDFAGSVGFRLQEGIGLYG